MENKFSAIGMILAPTFGGVSVLLLLFGAVAWTTKRVEVSLK